MDNQIHNTIVSFIWGIADQPKMPHHSLSIVLINWLRREVNIRRNKFLNHRPQNIRLNHRVNLIAEPELLQNLLHIRGETVQGYLFLL